ncbi:MAG: hypothetical protein IKU23_01595 [Clostridia bacterium]|nr:hypothetical protein [Clostridia bacterium]
MNKKSAIIATVINLVHIVIVAVGFMSVPLAIVFLKHDETLIRLVASFLIMSFFVVVLPILNDLLLYRYFNKFIKVYVFVLAFRIVSCVIALTLLVITEFVFAIFLLPWIISLGYSLLQIIKNIKKVRNSR